MPLLCNSDGCVVWISSDWRPRLLHGIASQFSRKQGIFRLGIEVANLSLSGAGVVNSPRSQLVLRLIVLVLSAAVLVLVLDS